MQELVGMEKQLAVFLVNSMVSTFIFMLPDEFQKMARFQFNPFFPACFCRKNSRVNTMDEVFKGFSLAMCRHTKAGCYLPNLAELFVFYGCSDPFGNLFACSEIGIGQQQDEFPFTPFPEQIG